MGGKVKVWSRERWLGKWKEGKGWDKNIVREQIYAEGGRIEDEMRRESLLSLYFMAEGWGGAISGGKVY